MLPPSEPVRPRRRRARILGLVAVVVALAGLAAVIQGWRVVDAIVQAERSAFVPLPTRQAAVVTGDDRELAADGRQLTPTAVPSVGVPGGNPLGGGGEARSDPAAGQPTPTAGPARNAAPPEGEDAETSRLDVVREVVRASTAGGDPGRSAIWNGRTDLYVLVVGVDRRPDGGDQNADVIILAHLDLVEKRLAAVSIPRDLLVEIPGIGPDKINSSYNHGVRARPGDPTAGIATVRDTVEAVFGVPIDGYVLVDFEGFREVIDAAGGVTLDVPYELVDEKYPTEDYGTEVVRFAPGRQRMDGERALKYVRTRHADGDDQRRQRQLDLMLALFDRGKSFSSISSADDVILAAGESVQTSFTLEEQLTLARVAYGMERDEIRTTTLGPPLLEPGYTPAGAWVYLGDPATYVAFVQDALATDPARYPPASPESE